MAWDQGNYIYVLLGAAGGDSNRVYFYRYNITDTIWEQLANTTDAQGAGDALTWSGYDNKVYALLGSRTHGAGFARYNPVGDSWETLTLDWTSIDDGASLAWTGGEYIYALRGEWEETNPHNDTARYHIPTGTWEPLSSIPTVNGVGDGASLLWIGNWVSEYSDYVFALSGNDVLENPGYNFTRYSISGNDWLELESIPYPVGYYPGNRLGFAGGHIYYWQGAPGTWDGGGNRFAMFGTQEITFDQVGVSSDFTGVLVTIDGVDYGHGNLPESFWWDEDSEHSFSYHSPLAVDSKRYVWAYTTGLSNLQGGTLTVTESGTVTGNYGTQYHLTVGINPHNLKPVPIVTPPNQWFDEGSLVTCTAQEVHGYYFSHWTVDNVSQGELVNPISVTMSAPRICVAYYQPIAAVGGLIIQNRMLCIFKILGAPALMLLIMLIKIRRKRKP